MYLIFPRFVWDRSGHAEYRMIHSADLIIILETNSFSVYKNRHGPHGLVFPLSELQGFIELYTRLSGWDGTSSDPL